MAGIAYRAWSQRPRLARSSWGPEHVFAGLVAVFGLVFALGMPPCQVPDEVSHWYRAYQISENRFFPVMVHEWGGGDLPVEVIAVVEAFNHLPFHAENRATRQNFIGLLNAPLGTGERTTVEFPGSVFYTFVPYLPQACGIALARAAGGNTLTVFYAGRLANLLLAVVLIYLAVRITPVFKVVLGMVALLPMSVHQLASLSPDSSTIAVSLLLIAVLFRLAAGGPEPGRRSWVVLLLGLAGWVTLCKFPYAALTLLYLAVPAANLGGGRRYLRVGCVLLLLTAVLGFAGTRMKRYAPDRLTTDTAAGVSMAKQVHFIQSQPLRYAGVVAATVAEHGQVWLDQMGTLGWLDTPVNPMAMHVFFTVLILVALGDRTAGVAPGLRLKTVSLLAACAGAAVILTSCYVCGGRYKAPLIIGPQGRYFIPLLPLLLLLLYNRTFQLQAHPRLIQALAAGTGAGVLLVAVGNFIRRYYFAPQLQLIVGPAALAAGFALCVVVVAVARRRAQVA